MPPLKLPDKLEVRPILHAYHQHRNLFDYLAPASGDATVEVAMQGSQLAGFHGDGTRNTDVSSWDVPEHLRDAIRTSPDRESKTKAINSSDNTRLGRRTTLHFGYAVTPPPGWSREQLQKVLDVLVKEADELSDAQWAESNKKAPVDRNGQRVQRPTHEKGFNKFFTVAPEPVIRNGREFFAEHLTSDMFFDDRLKTEVAPSKTVTPDQLVDMIRSLGGVDENRPSYTRWEDVGTSRHVPAPYKPVSVSVDPISDIRSSARSDKIEIGMPKDKAYTDVVKKTVEKVLEQHKGYKLGVDDAGKVVVHPPKGFFGLGSAKPEEIRAVSAEINSAFRELAKRETVTVTIGGQEQKPPAKSVTPPEVETKRAQAPQPDAPAKPPVQKPAPTVADAPPAAKQATDVAPQAPAPQVQQPQVQQPKTQQPQAQQPQVQKPQVQQPDPLIKAPPPHPMAKQQPQVQQPQAQKPQAQQPDTLIKAPPPHPMPKQQPQVQQPQAQPQPVQKPDPAIKPPPPPPAPKQRDTAIKPPPPPPGMNKRYANGGVSEWRGDPVATVGFDGEIKIRDLSPQEKVLQREMSAASKSSPVSDAPKTSPVATSADVPPLAAPEVAKAPSVPDASPSAPRSSVSDLAGKGAGTALGTWNLVDNIMAGDEIGSAISAVDLGTSLLKNAPRALGPGVTVVDGAYQVAKEARGANEAAQPVPDLTEKMVDRAMVTTAVGGVGAATAVVLGAGAAPVVATIAVTAAVGKVAEETIATNADFREAQRAFEQSANNKHINSIAYRGAYVDKVLEQGGKLQEGVPGKKLDLGDAHTRELLRDAIADRQKELQAVVDAGSKMDIRSGNMPGWLRTLVVAASPQSVVINQLIPGSEAYANKVNEAMSEQQLLNAASKEMAAVDKSARIRDEIRERLLAEAAASPDAATPGADKSADAKKPDVMDHVKTLQESGRTYDNPSATPPSVAASASAPGMTGMGLAKGPGKVPEGRS